MSTYTPIVVVDGQSKIADSIAGGAAINISHLAVGDGNGAAIVAVENMVGLVHEVDRVTVTSAVRDATDPTMVIVTATIPISSGPYVIREVAIFTNDGKLFAIGAYPETFKPTAAQGATVAVDVQFIVKVSSTAQVTITVDPANLVSIAGLARVPFIAIDNHLQNDPQPSPVLGSIYSVGPAPTGAWLGAANKLAQWNGTLWAVAEAPERTVIGDKTSGLYYRRTPTGWVEWKASEVEEALIKIATDAEAQAGVNDEHAITPKKLRSALSSALNGWEIQPHILNATNTFTVTASPGQVVLGSDADWLWRLTKRFKMSDLSLAARTLATQASKTYHLCVYPSGLGRASDTTAYPANICRPYLEDVTDTVGYNTGNVAETDPALDGQPDRMLVARVVTNASNVPTVQTLMNRWFLGAEVDLYQSTAGVQSTYYQPGQNQPIATSSGSGQTAAANSIIIIKDGVTGYNTIRWSPSKIALNWARRPKMVPATGLMGWGPYASVSQTPLLSGWANEVIFTSVDRYGVQATVSSDYDDTAVWNDPSGTNWRARLNVQPSAF